MFSVLEAGIPPSRFGVSGFGLPVIRQRARTREPPMECRPQTEPVCSQLVECSTLGLNAIGTRGYPITRRNR